MSRSMRARWRANDADAEQTRRRLGKRVIGRGGADNRGGVRFSGIFRVPSLGGDPGRAAASSNARANGSLSGKRQLFAMTGLRNKRRNGRRNGRRRRGGSPARGIRAGSNAPARRPGPGGGGGAIQNSFFSRRGNQAESEWPSSPTTRPESPGVFFPPTTRPRRVPRTAFDRRGRPCPAQRTPRARPRRRRRRRRRRHSGGAATRREVPRGRAVPRGDRREEALRVLRERAAAEARAASAGVVVGVVVALAGEAERRARGRRRGRVAGPTAELERDAGDARALRYKVREGRARAYEAPSKGVLPFT